LILQKLILTNWPAGLDNFYFINIRLFHLANYPIAMARSRI
jgi:hypothetical protein